MLSSQLTCGFILTLLAFSGPALGGIYNTKYVLEVLAVLDKPAFDAWMRLDGVDSESRVREEITALFFEVNYIYHSYRAYGIHLEIRLWDILITDETIVSNDDDVYTTDGLNNFYRWLEAKRIVGWDHALVFTHADIYQEDNSIIGTAYMNNICEKAGVSMIELGFYYGIAMVIAHEMSHSYDVDHDTDYGNKACDGMALDEVYIMYPAYVDGTSGRWFFSPCSAESLINKLYQDSSSCLKETTSPPIVSRRMGEMLKAEEFCERERDWTDAIWPDSDEGDDLCMALDCWDGWYDTFDANSPEGLPCGSGKRCFMGRCVSSD